MLFINGLLSIINGIILIAGFICFMIYIIISSKKAAKLQLMPMTIDGTKQAGNEICTNIESEQNKACENVITKQKENCRNEKPEKPAGKNSL